ncbi:hypothetical protein [uncultured Clostridium sp.]|uniref:hypothetical protein n=1 Tax=uncultured Clostridium sp. TaxID=59620 RepID=UPI0026339CBF|nr:hypothetical protein [uncultured Clostridium sp.]
MSRIILLLRYYLKMPRKKKGIQIPTGVKYLLFAIIMLLLSSGYAAAVGGAYGILDKIGKESLLIQMILVSGSMLTLVIGFFNVINTFFLAEDVEAFLPLPFKASEIVFSKLISTLAYLYIYSLIIVMPLITYGIVSGARWLFYVYVVCAYIFNPIIPMIFAFIISSILMKLGNLSKHKDALKVVFTVVLIALIIISNVMFKGNNPGIQTAAVVSAKESFIHVLSLIFINIKLEASALVGYENAGGILNILASLLIVIVLIGILYVVSEKLYLRGLKDSTDKTRVKKAKKITIKESSVLRALVIKEFKVIFRTPTFLVNSVVMLFYIPIIYFFLIASSSLTSQYWHFGFIVVGATTLAISLGMSSGSAASTALSREGNNILISKYIPVSYKTQALAKIISSFLINSLIIILGIGMLIFENVNLEIMILSIIIQILTCFFMSMLGIFFDYSNPKVSWQTEKNLYRGNFRNLGNMIVAVVFGGILLAIAFVVKEVLIVFVIDVIVLVVAIGILSFILNKKIVKTYNNL